MADNNNPSNEPAEDLSKGNPDDGKPAVNGDDGSSKPNVDATEQARRDQQSKKDQANSEKDELKEQVDFLTAKEAERARDSYVSELLSDKDKFPDVKATDPMFKYATSKEEVEEIATELQNKFMEHQQAALSSVQTESEQSLTDEEIASKEEEMAKDTEETGKSNFSNFMDNLGRRKKA